MPLQKVRTPTWMLILALLFTSGVAVVVRADEPVLPRLDLPTLNAFNKTPAQAGGDKKADEPADPKTIDKTPAKKSSEGNDDDAKKPEKEKKKEKDASPTPKKFDPAVVSAGMAAFERSCTSCHDAARSLERTKDLAGWRATVRRMAAKRGADVAGSDIEPIAVYLTSRNSAAAGAVAENEKGSGSDAAAGSGGAGAGSSAAAKSGSASADDSTISTFATISPLWRGGNNQLQNSGFAPLAWVGGNWQSKYVSARATLCISCHGVQEQAYLSRIDLVEAAVRVDLSEFLGSCSRGVKGGVDAGRFVVPFGAFSSQTNPGLYRTVSTPLVFNMGQRVFNRDLGDPVLPMPYSDTGINLNFDVPLGDLGTGPITASLDGYLVNGLAGNANGIDFLQSRNLLDNNNHAAGGGRFTIGDPFLRAGVSCLGGRFSDPNDPGAPNNLHYRIYGFDVQARYKKLFRCQLEYARRDSDRIGALANGPAEFYEKVDGYYLEAEVRPWQECRVSFLARHDFMRRGSPLPPPTSAVATGNFNVDRFTLGVNVELWHQSLLMFNVERWLVPVPANAINVFGVRYTVTF